MNKKQILRCLVIGSDNLTLQCLGILLQKKHHLVGVISAHDGIKSWCLSREVLQFDSPESFEKAGTKPEVDVLFSIVNEHILSSEMLEYPKLGAINYHNSPLPKYAGLYATSWAILNGETQHAITWHWMKAQVDAGDILKQPEFPIESEDTALTLNLKCYEQAIQAFSELLDELATHSIVATKQNLALRTYYGLKDKPKNLGFISFHDSSEQIHRLCRALYVGAYRNELATPKILFRDQVLIVQSCQVLSEKTALPPGTLVRLHDRAIQISTSTTDVLLGDFIDLQGHPFLFENRDLNRELYLSQPLESRSSPKNEKFWVNQYKKCIQNELVFLSQLNLSEHAPEKTLIRFSEEERRLLQAFSKKIGVPQKYIVLALVLVYWYRLNNYKNFSVDYWPLRLRHEEERPRFLSEHIPLTTHFSHDMSFYRSVLWLFEEDNLFANYDSYLPDIFVRYPEIKTASSLIDLVVGFSESDASEDNYHHKRMCVSISEDGSGLTFYNCTNYQDRCLSFAFLNRTTEHLLNLLQDGLERPQTALFELSLLTQEERGLLGEWNTTEFLYDKTKLLHQYLEEQAAQTPEATAAIFDDLQITYEELNQKANQIAYYLIHNNIVSDDLIGVYMHRGLDMLICIFGILKAGAAYLPLDPHYPEKRIEYMLHHSQAKVVLVNQARIDLKLDGYDGKVTDVSLLLAHSDVCVLSPRLNTHHENLAYVIYTSGTTGTPKGVAITHRSACHHMLWMRNAYDFSHNDTFLLKTPFSFDASVWEIFMPFFVGAKLVVAPNDAHMNPETLIDLVQRYRISILQLVPSMFRELMLTNRLETCLSLRHVFCGGEVLLQEMIHTFLENNPAGARLHNLYGPTETTIDAVTLTCSASDVSSVVSRIGRPIYNTKLWVLDEQKQLLPIGVLGELYISGDGLAKGYLNHVEMTHQKFLPHPFDAADGAKVYKTGDLVKWQNDGIMEYHGRTDSQVKIRGFRIEVSEIESCLEKHPKICQCLVKPEPNHDGSMGLSAYFTVKDPSMTVADIRAVLKKDIPDYMIPTRYFIMDKLPTTPSGKLDRSIQLSPIKQLYFAKEHTPPSTETEILLHHIWREVLNQSDFGIHDDFFELGGHSLLAMQIVAKIKQQCFVRVPIRSFFDYSTIEKLAKKVEKMMHHDAEVLVSDSQYANIVIPIKKTGNQRPLFLVHPIGGGVFWYTAMAEYLDANVPLYGLQDPGIEAQSFIFESIENMAHAYIEAMRIYQPEGPYLIGGASFGSTVAVEMARQLAQQGELVEAIISLDGWAVYPSLQSNEAYFREKMKRQNASMIDKYTKYDVLDPEFLLELQWHRERLLTNYQLPIIQARFILFKAETLNDMFNYEAPLNWWDDYTHRMIECYLVPGDHETMFVEPHVKYLMEKLNDALLKGRCHEKK